jgi:hypothetical protein
MNNEKTAEYVAPTVTTLGSVASLTLGGTTGNYLDANYPAGTPRGSLTFS